MIYCTAMVTNCNGPIFTFVQMDEFKITYKLWGFCRVLIIGW